MTSTVSGGSILRSRRQETILSHKRVSERLPTVSPHFLLVLVQPTGALCFLPVLCFGSSASALMWPAPSPKRKSMSSKGPKRFLPLGCWTTWITLAVKCCDPTIIAFIESDGAAASGK